MIVDSNSIAKCVKRKTQMQLEEGKIFPLFHCAPAKGENFCPGSFDSGWTMTKTVSFLHPCLLGNFFPLRRLSSSKQNAFFSLHRVAFVRKEKKEKMCFNFSDTCTKVPHTIFFIVTLFFPPLQLLFVLGCVRRRSVCVCGGYFSDKNRTKFKTKIT